MSGYHRKKQPELVKAALEDEAIRIALNEGIQAITVQSVSAGAGVTKGGFMHHFPTKKALLVSAFEKTLMALDQEIDQLMAVDTRWEGSFSRAYIEAAFSSAWDKPSPSRATVAALALGDSVLKARWNDWYLSRMLQHADSDSGEFLTIARFAADGIWLASLCDLPIADLSPLREKLLAMTYSPLE